ncbi:MAG: GNAT family N-acetyltransferase [Lachnospiraceae bacterium]|nr:GNAT family N-acetyltransferase [Lachnospiraceae bacterium]
MKNITTRQFSVLADCGKIYQFMLDIYERDWRNGVPAPFFEYAFSSFAYWMDITYSYKNRIWEDNGKIVAFCFYENPMTDIFFSLKPGYEELASEMIAYADTHMSIKDGKIQLVLFGGQDALMSAAKQAGYHQKSEYWDMQFDFDDVLDYPLPKGFHFVDPDEYDLDKGGKCCWKGFDHEQDEGPWNHQYEQNNYLLEVAPHATTNLSVTIADEKGEYACYAGMWWTPENKLAYMEPLCTIPEYRRKGLAAAALSEMYRRTKALGATHMTGGANGFYKAIGYKPAEKWTYWEKQ